MCSAAYRIVLLIFGMKSVETQFTNAPQSNMEGCTGDTVFFNWTFSTAVPTLLVEWKVNGSTIAVENVGGGQPFSPVPSYSARLAKISNAQISLGPVSQSDFGTYTCIMTNTNGQSFSSNGITLSVYDTYNSQVKIEKSEEDEKTILKPASFDSSITYTWSIGGESTSGDNYLVEKSGNYTLCISGGKAVCLNQSLSSCTSLEVTIQGSATTESTTQLSTDRTIITTSVSETSSKISTELLSLSSQTTVTLTDKSTLEETLPGSTESNGTKSETSTVPVTTSPSGLSEEMIIIIIIILSVVGGILLLVIIVIVVLCCKQRASTAESEKHRKKHGKLHIKNENNKDLNSNYDQSQKIKQPTHSGKKTRRGTILNQKHPKNDILYGSRMPTGVEYPRSKNYFPRNQHHYRNQDISAYYLPYTDPRNVMYHQRYPGSRYSEDISGYRREGPYRMQQVYPKSYSRQDRYTEDGLERRIGHRRGEYEAYWGKNDTLY